LYLLTGVLNSLLSGDGKFFVFIAVRLCTSIFWVLLPIWIKKVLYLGKPELFFFLIQTMKHMQRITLSFLLLISFSTTFAQDFYVPNNPTLENEVDYKKQEKNVVDGINWLENTEVGKQSEKRIKANAFILKWMMGTPTITIGVQDFQSELTRKNSDLLITFLGGWSKFAIENPTEKDNQLKCNLAGFQSLLKVYTLNKGVGMKKDKKVEKLIKMNASELENWVKENLE